MLLGNIIVETGIFLFFLFFKSWICVSIDLLSEDVFSHLLAFDKIADDTALI